MQELEHFFSNIISDAVRKNMPTNPEKSKGVRIKGIRGLASHLGASTATIQRLKNEGVLPFYCVGNRTYFYADEVDAALKGGR